MPSLNKNAHNTARKGEEKEDVDRRRLEVCKYYLYIYISPYLSFFCRIGICIFGRRIWIYKIDHDRSIPRTVQYQSDDIGDSPCNSDAVERRRRELYHVAYHSNQTASPVNAKVCSDYRQSRYDINGAQRLRVLPKNWIPPSWMWRKEITITTSS